MKYILILCLFLAIVLSFSACSAGLVIGHRNKQYQETSTKVSVDSVNFIPSLQIR